MEVEDVHRQHSAHGAQGKSTIASRGGAMKEGTNTAGPAFHAHALANYEARNFKYQCRDGVAFITLDRPEHKNPLTFESYAELRDLFRAMAQAADEGHAIATLVFEIPGFVVG